MLLLDFQKSHTAPLVNLKNYSLLLKGIDEIMSDIFKFVIEFNISSTADKINVLTIACSSLDIYSFSLLKFIL